MDGLEDKWVTGGGISDSVCQGNVDSLYLLVKCIEGKELDVHVVLGGIHMIPME